MTGRREKILKRRWNAIPRTERAEVKRNLQRFFDLLHEHAKTKMNIPEAVLKIFEGKKKKNEIQDRTVPTSTEGVPGK